MTLSAVLLTLALTANDGLAPLPGDTRPVEYKLAVTLDAPASRYSVQSTVSFEVLKPTRAIVIHSRDLKIDSANLGTGEAATISYDVDRQQVSFTFAKQLPVGRHELRLTFSNSIGDQVEGLFKVRYPDIKGGEKQMFFTHLCCIVTGRRFMPEWDLPDLKAVFDLTLVVPAGFDAVSNMPVDKRESLPNGMVRVTFQRTPKMSSYLLFFGAGEFDRIVGKVGATEVGVITQRGKAEQGRYALQANMDVLAYYNDYFGTAYPLPKLDSVTFPGAGNFGAMENWGSIFYFEPYLLLDPASSTKKDRQGIYEIVAHEVSHQWFGNLVTMRTWDDLWLNEGFASWMALKATDKFNPDWNMWLHATTSRETAMRLDARSSTHPIIRSVRTMEEAELAFDEITYEKGSQVIRMIEAYVGDEPFRKAIQTHVQKHAYGNAVTNDLWQELEKTSPSPVTAIAKDFTEQDGVPLIDVLSTECAAGSDVTRVTLSQGRFGIDAHSKQPRDWRVPVSAAVLGHGDVTRQVVRGSGRTPISVKGCGPVKVNAGESSYFRTRYDKASFTALEKRFTELSAADQLGLLNDQYSLAEAGYVSFDNYLQLTTHLSAASDPVVLLQLVRTVDTLDGLYGRNSTQFRAHARKRLGALLKSVKWDPVETESANVGILRDELIETLAELGDPDSLAEALRRFRSGEKRKAIVNAVGSGADVAQFEDLTGRATRSKDTTDKRLYLLAAARSDNPTVATRALNFALTDAVPQTLTTSMMAVVAARHPQLVFDYATKNYDAIAKRLDSFSGIAFIPDVAENSADRALAERLTAFEKARMNGAGRETFERSRSMILFRDEVRRERLPQVDAWLRTHGGS